MLGGDAALEVGLDLVLITGVAVDDVPVAELGAHPLAEGLDRVGLVVDDVDLGLGGGGLGLRGGLDGLLDLGGLLGRRGGLDLGLGGGVVLVRGVDLDRGRADVRGDDVAEGGGGRVSGVLDVDAAAVGEHRLVGQGVVRGLGHGAPRAGCGVVLGGDQPKTARTRRPKP